MHKLVRIARNKYDVFRVFPNDTNENAVRVTFGSRDRWVGFDYWKHEGTWTLSQLQRGVKVMAELERRKDTDRWLYRLAQRTTIGHFLLKMKEHKL